MTLSLKSNIAILYMNDPTTWFMFHGKLPIYQSVKTVKLQEVPDFFPNRRDSIAKESYTPVQLAGLQSDPRVPPKGSGAAHIFSIQNKSL